MGGASGGGGLWALQLMRKKHAQLSGHSPFLDITMVLFSPCFFSEVAGRLEGMYEFSKMLISPIKIKENVRSY